MNLHSIPLLFAQMTTPDDLVREAARLQRNYEFLSYGLTVAWVILVIYVLFMVSRGRKLKREIASLKAMLEDRQKT
ncbi:MAG: CcmD family protein [Bryobacteraceae bacterium]